MHAVPSGPERDVEPSRVAAVPMRKPVEAPSHAHRQRRAGVHPSGSRRRNDPVLPGSRPTARKSSPGTAGNHWSAARNQGSALSSTGRVGLVREFRRHRSLRPLRVSLDGVLAHARWRTAASRHALPAAWTGTWCCFGCCPSWAILNGPQPGALTPAVCLRFTVPDVAECGHQWDLMGLDFREFPRHPGRCYAPDRRAGHL